MIPPILYNIKDKIWSHTHADNEYNRIRKDPKFMASMYISCLLEYAKTIPYYSKTNTSLLSDFAILEKKDVRENQSSLISRRLPKNWYYNTSGGSTGEPLQFIQDKKYNTYVGYAITYYYREVLGYDIRPMKKLLIWGSGSDIQGWNSSIKKQIQLHLGNSKIVNAFSMRDSEISDLVSFINKFKPDLIRGYASSLFHIAKLIKANNLKIFRPLLLLSSAETLSVSMREVIEEAFGIQVLDIYGSRECGMLAGQCYAGNYHLMLFNNFVELDKTTPKNSNREILVTTLHNYSMPLIRYRIGDCAEEGPLICACGNCLPTLKRVIGRTSDIFYTKSGQAIHGEFFSHLFYFKKWIRRFQVIQDSYFHLIIKIEKYGDNLSLSLEEQNEVKEITKLIQIKMGSDCKVDIIIQKILPTIHGKHLYTFNAINKMGFNDSY